MISLQHIYKTFQTRKNNTVALQDVSLEINEGEIFGVIGFSGAGKSTLIRCINLLEKPDSGKVFIKGVDLLSLDNHKLREERKKIGMIFQHFNLMESRTIADNIAFPLKGSKLSKKEIKNKVSQLLALVDLKEKKDAYPSQLSGGQKQRVAIARALANDPDILLCDEATSALDPKTTQSILQLIKKVNQELNITVVIITHEMSVIKEICDHVAVMEHGEIVEWGTVMEIFTHPQQTITKAFLDASSSIHRIYELLANDQELQFENGSKIIRLKYTSTNTKEALISKISKEFHIDVSIIFGNIEIIEEQPVGELVVVLEGESHNVQDAINYIQKQGVEVEVMKTC